MVKDLTEEMYSTGTVNESDGVMHIINGSDRFVDIVCVLICFFFQAEDGIRDWSVTGVQTCALFFSSRRRHTRLVSDWSSDVCSSDLMIRHTRLVSDWSSDVCSSD